MRGSIILKIRIYEIIALAFATGFGAGYSPVAPGTVGSFLAIFFFWGLSSMNIYIYLLTLLVIFFIGLWASNVAGIYFKDPDASTIVIDEMIGIFLAYIPLFYFPKDAFNLTAGFLLFRIFDILKPFPASHANKIKRPLFVILDDVVSAIYVAIVLILLNVFFRSGSVSL